jgi:ribosomal protein S12 methylthiotransferase accessory factor
LLDSRFGIVSRAFRGERDAGSPEFFHYYAEAYQAGALSDDPAGVTSGGAATDRDTALAKAIGESLERYCASIYDRDSLPLLSYEQASFRCAAPERFERYAASQLASEGFPFVRFDRSTPVRWFPAVDVSTRETFHVPAAFVFVPYFFDTARGELPIAQPISTGLACHASYEAACVSAACEVVERDAFTITWQAMLSPPRISRRSIVGPNAGRLARFTDAGYDVALFDITTDIAIPTILAAARHDADSEPALVVAAAAHPDTDTALRKALEELEHTRAWCKRLKCTMPPVSDPARVQTQRDHLRFWCERENQHFAAFLFRGTEERELGALTRFADPDPSLGFKAVADAIVRAGLQLFLTDVTTADVRELGLCVVRAIVPSLHPLVVGHEIRALGGHRLFDVPLRLGYRPRTSAESLNEMPHPFP